MAKFPPALEQLIDEFRYLPGVGPKTAERFALYVSRQPKEKIERFAATLLRAHAALGICPMCFTISEQSPCSLCADSRRDSTTLCVVAEPQDVLAIERSGAFHGKYHVLGGVLSPIEGVTPEQLKIAELVQRVKTPKDQNTKEVIIALDPNIEGEATTLYLKKLLQQFPITITRLARGLPLGSDIEYADDVTLADAMSGRRTI